MLKIAHYQRNANQTYNEISTHTHRMAIIKKSRNNTFWRGCGEKGTLLLCWLGCKLLQPLWRTVWRFLKKLETKLPNDPIIPLLGFSQRKPQLKKTHVSHSSLQHCLQQLGHGSNLDGHRQMNRKRSGTCIQRNITWP